MPLRIDQTQKGFAKKRLAVILAGGVVGIAVGLGAVYGIGSVLRNAGDPACRPALEVAKGLAPLARGEVAAVAITTEPRRVPPLTFLDSGGVQRTLAEWEGRLVLLNLWATWCVPCREEMPALDTLQEKLGGPEFEVVAVNIDTRNPNKPKQWLAEIGVSHLAYYADPTAKTFQDLKAVGRAIGMPTTVLVDPKGCELGVLAGPAQWSSEDAIRLIEAAKRT